MCKRTVRASKCTSTRYIRIWHAYMFTKYICMLTCMPYYLLYSVNNDIAWHYMIVDMKLSGRESIYIRSNLYGATYTLTDRLEPQSGARLRIYRAI